MHMCTLTHTHHSQVFGHSPMHTTYSPVFARTHASTTPNVRLFCTHRKCGRNGASSVRKFPFAHAFLMIPAGIVRRARTKTPTPTNKKMPSCIIFVSVRVIFVCACASRGVPSVHFCAPVCTYIIVRFGGSWLDYGRI